MTDRVWFVHPGFTGLINMFLRTQPGTPAKTEEKTSHVIRVRGLLTREPSLASHFFGWSTYEGIKNQIQKALQDKSIKEIILDIDSPGGSAYGVTDLARFIRQASIVKPITAKTGAMMASAAYYLASAATRIVATHPAQIGSIGVVLIHHDYSKMLDEMGIKTTYFYRGKYKLTGSPEKPVEDHEAEEMQSMVDSLYEIFTSDVALYRGLDKKAVEATEARVFDSEEALAIGLIDSIERSELTMENLDLEITMKENEELKARLEQLEAELRAQARRTEIKTMLTNRVIANKMFPKDVEPMTEVLIRIDAVDPGLVETVLSIFDNYVDIGVISQKFEKPEEEDDDMDELAIANDIAELGRKMIGG